LARHSLYLGTPIGRPEIQKANLEAFGSHLRFDNKIQDVLEECLKKSVPANLIPKKPQGNLEKE
jgi:hypothetical protein